MADMRKEETINNYKKDALPEKPTFQSFYAVEIEPDGKIEVHCRWCKNIIAFVPDLGAYASNTWRCLFCFPNGAPEKGNILDLEPRIPEVFPSQSNTIQYFPEFIPTANAERLGLPLYIEEARIQARRSLCLVRRVGSVVVNIITGQYLGKGANFPPDFQKPTLCNKTILPRVGGPNDRHCCLHAEQVALTEAFMHYPARDLEEGTVIFADIDADNNLIPCAGKPYCTQCSKFAYYLRVKYWICYHAKGVWSQGEGFYRYTAKGYNSLSYQFREGG